MNRRYVVGFAFTDDKHQVVTIVKNRPEWQRGRCNGVGGKIEEGESPFEAMVREYHEEAGVHTMEWKHRGEMVLEGAVVYLFSLFSNEVVETSRTMTDEIIKVQPSTAEGIYPLPVRNLSWLLPLMKDPFIDKVTICGRDELMQTVAEDVA